MDNSNDKMRKRDIIKHGLDKAASKLGFSSHSQEGSSSLQDAIAPSITSSLSVTPVVSQAHKDAFYPAPPPTQGAEDQGEVRYKAPINPGSRGDKKVPNPGRLPRPEKNDNKKQEDDKKKEDSKKKADNKKEEDHKKGEDDKGKNVAEKKNANKLSDNKTGGKSGKH
ncbi:hypothetical protein D9619_008034 [Psilocybe cf. subviscida]|uniref:Uncharacterized protein n=1 Tax=Psilocybe cf. subviscida TaxID=2480587 RepID=A0A8H5ESW7_9AGAR|nr:hypothetical protein D9619_008034 [Psilocybe cf. subviscida]